MCCDRVRFVCNRRLAATAAATATSTSSAMIPTPEFTKDLSWPLGKVAFSLLPLAATSTRRATLQETIIEDTIWTHDQIQGVVNVNVPVRQTVVRLSKEAGGGLLVYNPIAPTPQVISMMKDLEMKYGPVRHIILGTVALEHKVGNIWSICTKIPKCNSMDPTRSMGVPH